MIFFKKSFSTFLLFLVIGIVSSSADHHIELPSMEGYTAEFQLELKKYGQDKDYKKLAKAYFESGKTYYSNVKRFGKLLKTGANNKAFNDLLVIVKGIPFQDRPVGDIYQYIGISFIKLGMIYEDWALLQRGLELLKISLIEKTSEYKDEYYEMYNRSFVQYDLKVSENYFYLAKYHSDLATKINNQAEMAKAQDYIAKAIENIESIDKSSVTVKVIGSYYGLASKINYQSYGQFKDNNSLDKALFYIDKVIFTINANKPVSLMQITSMQFKANILISIASENNDLQTLDHARKVNLEYDELFQNYIKTKTDADNFPDSTKLAAFIKKHNDRDIALKKNLPQLSKKIKDNIMKKNDESQKTIE